MREGPLTLPRCPKEFTPRKGWDPFFPPGLRPFSALAVSPSLSVALRLRPALGSLRSSENSQQRGIREFFNSLLGAQAARAVVRGVHSPEAESRTEPSAYTELAPVEASTVSSMTTPTLNPSL